MRSIDWQKGFFRLTLVVSILLGVLALMVIIANVQSEGVTIFSIIILPGLPWLAYFAICFIVRGFGGKSGSATPIRRTGRPQPEPQQWTCPECNKSNPNSTFTCESCGYNIN